MLLKDHVVPSATPRRAAGRWAVPSIAQPPFIEMLHVHYSYGQQICRKMFGDSLFHYYWLLHVFNQRYLSLLIYSILILNIGCGWCATTGTCSDAQLFPQPPISPGPCSGVCPMSNQCWKTDPSVSTMSSYRHYALFVTLFIIICRCHFVPLCWLDIQNPVCINRANPCAAGIFSFSLFLPSPFPNFRKGTCSTCVSLNCGWCKAEGICAEITVDGSSVCANCSSANENIIVNGTYCFGM